MAVSKREAKEEAAQTLQFSFTGKGSTLFGIHIVNLFLTIITLGIYHFWAKVKVRKYLWGQFEVAGDRFAYHGTAKEIFLGWIKAVAVFGIPYLALQQAPVLLKWGVVAQLVGGLAAFILLMFFIPFAIVGARRYRLSRSSWRNVRFSFRGKVKECFQIYLKGTLLSMITLGIYAPWFFMNLQRFLTGNSHFGNRKFSFDGKGGDLIGGFLLSLLLAIPTLFLSLLWFNVKLNRYTWEHTRLGEAQFRSGITFGGLLGLTVTNFLLVLVTLGFGFSWAQVRQMRYIATNLHLDGPADLDSIAQEPLDSAATAEEIAGFLDLDLDLA